MNLSDLDDTALMHVACLQHELGRPITNCRFYKHDRISRADWIVPFESAVAMAF